MIVFWLMGLALLLIIVCLFTYALMCAASDEDRKKEDRDVLRMGGARGADRD